MACMPACSKLPSSILLKLVNKLVYERAFICLAHFTDADWLFSTWRSLNAESHPGSMEMDIRRAGWSCRELLYYLAAIVSLDFWVDASKDV